MSERICFRLAAPEWVNRGDECKFAVLTPKIDLDRARPNLERVIVSTLIGLVGGHARPIFHAQARNHAQHSLATLGEINRASVSAGA